MADIEGTNRKDTLVATQDEDRLFGLGGSDTLISEQFNLTEHFGGRGNDSLLVTLEFDVNEDPPFIPNPVFNLLDGGSGRDHLVVDASVIAAFDLVQVENMLDGGAGNDRISATAVAANVGGDDASAMNTIDGGSGNDHVEATATAAVLEASSEATNDLTGGDGNDNLIATASAREALNFLDGGAGNDTLDATAIGRSGGREAINELYGGSGNDHLTATARYFYVSDEFGGFGTASNILDAGGGSDTLEAVAWSEATGPGESALATNALDGGTGNDYLDAIATAISLGFTVAEFATAMNLLDGGAGNDHLEAMAIAREDGPSLGSATATNEIHGGDGRDEVKSTAIAEALAGPGVATNLSYGGAGNDYLEARAMAPGNEGMNHLDGGPGHDTLVALIGEETFGFSDLFGDIGNDDLTVFGGDGNRLEGGLGNDDLTGSIGQDNFVYEKPESDNLGWDDIFGFEDDFDKVVLDGYAREDLSIDNVRDIATLSDGTRISFANFEGVLTQDDFDFVASGGLGIA